MSTSFKSRDIFNDKQIRLMITDLRDILGRLKENSVLDFLKENTIRLLDSKNTSIEFRRTEYTEIKRFLSLVRASLPVLTYLTRNPTSITVINEIERQDRIMGSTNIQKTILVNRQISRKSKSVVCNEIHRTINSPENQILADILLSIILYCDRYISRSGFLNSGAHLDNPTLDYLKSIRNYAISLLSSNTMKRTLPYAIDSISNFDILFRSMIDRIYLGKVPKYFIGIYNLLHKWKYFVWVSSKKYDLIENTLWYHFFNLRKYEELYECWVFYKILDLLTYMINLRLKETTHTEGVASFRSRDGSIKVTYQRKYKTGWMDKDEPIYDKPDIVIEINNAKTVILDVKNSILRPSMPYPYRRQMDGYIRSSGIEKTNFGIIIFSTAAQEHWREIKKQEQKIIWIGLSPGSDSKTSQANEQAIEKIIQIITLCCKK
jgi:hypothetical protein